MSKHQETARGRDRTLELLVLASALNQSMHTGGRVAVALAAIALQAPPVVIGSITALYGLLPMALSLAVGKLNDRIGPRAPIFAGTLFFIAGGLVPAFAPSLPMLYVAATLIGLGNMTFQVSSQNAGGHLGRPEDRTRNFSWIAIGMSSGAILGPLIAGYAIDHAGHQTAFILLALLPMLALVLQTVRPLALPRPAPRPATARAQRSRDLLRNRGLVAIYAITGLHVMSWELFSFLMPMHGSAIGLSASTIGVIMGAFSAASFLMRLILPPLARRFDHWQVIKGSLVMGGLVFCTLPLVSHPAALVALAFVLGGGLGAAQPLTMTLMHETAPTGRVGESLGIRTTVVCSFQFAMPLIFGALGSAFGLGAVFWSVSLAIWCGVAASRTPP